MNNDKTIIGRTAKMDIVAESIVGVPVKIDTGADGSAIWASDIEVNKAGELVFSLFGVGSPFYTGKRHSFTDFDVRVVRSAHGNLQVRYRVVLPVVIGGRRVRTRFTLADRSKNIYPALIGCRLLSGRFLVDVSLDSAKQPEYKPNSNEYNKELKRDPYAFYQKYHQNNQRGDIE